MGMRAELKVHPAHYFLRQKVRSGRAKDRIKLKEAVRAGVMQEKARLRAKMDAQREKAVQRKRAKTTAVRGGGAAESQETVMRRGNENPASYTSESTPGSRPHLVVSHVPAVTCASGKATGSIAQRERNSIPSETAALAAPGSAAKSQRERVMGTPKVPPRALFAEVESPDNLSSASEQWSSLPAADLQWWNSAAEASVKHAKTKKESRAKQAEEREAAAAEELREDRSAKAMAEYQKRMEHFRTQDTRSTPSASDLPARPLPEDNKDQAVQEARVGGGEEKVRTGIECANAMGMRKRKRDTNSGEDKGKVVTPVPQWRMQQLLAERGVARSRKWIYLKEQEAGKCLSVDELVQLDDRRKRRKVPKVEDGKCTQWGMQQLLAERGVVRSRKWIYFKEQEAGKPLSVDELVQLDETLGSKRREWKLMKLLAERGVVRSRKWICLKEQEAGKCLSVDELVQLDEKQGEEKTTPEEKEPREDQAAKVTTGGAPSLDDEDGDAGGAQRSPAPAGASGVVAKAPLILDDDNDSSTENSTDSSTDAAAEQQPSSLEWRAEQERAIERPSPPSCAFTMFTAAVNPGSVRKASVLWRTASTAERQRWEQRAVQARAEYEEKMDDFRSKRAEQTLDLLRHKMRTAHTADMERIRTELLAGVAVEKARMRAEIESEEGVPQAASDGGDAEERGLEGSSS
eukprot:Hpha_TRINITY_DN11256_c0_g1::TRINITY_DN11256_c0_g1_i1::g.167638::m.167638